jgi:hypothetical protein
MLGHIYGRTAFRNGSIAMSEVVSRQQINPTLVKTVITAVEFVVAIFQHARLFRRLEPLSKTITVLLFQWLSSACTSINKSDARKNTFHS